MEENNRNTTAENDSSARKAPGLFDVAKSVMWAMLGVQKTKNYERDFQYGKPWQYIILGLIAVGLFISVIVTIVSLVLP